MQRKDFLKNSNLLLLQRFIYFLSDIFHSPIKEMYVRILYSAPHKVVILLMRKAVIKKNWMACRGHDFLQFKANINFFLSIKIIENVQCFFSS